MLNLFFHTRCKQTKFCNKQCELEAHTKEKSTKKEPENPSGGTEDLLKKEVEAEMKRQDKKERKTNRIFKMMATSAMSTCQKDILKAFEDLKNPTK